MVSQRQEMLLIWNVFLRLRHLGGGGLSDRDSLCARALVDAVLLLDRILHANWAKKAQSIRTIIVIQTPLRIVELVDPRIATHLQT